MIENFLKIAWRNLVKNKAHSFINITGLSVGLACSLMIMLWVQSELNIDAYHVKGARLYEVYERAYEDHEIDGDYETPAIMATELKRMLPGVEYAVNTEDVSQPHTFSSGNKILKLEGIFAGVDLFKMFSYPLLLGTPQTALNSPVSMAISQKMADQFFGSPQAAMGKILRFENKKDFMVTAVFRDLPENSSRKFEYVINWYAYLADHPWMKAWDNAGPLTFVLLRPGANPTLINKKLTHFQDAYIKPTSSFWVEYGMQRFDQVFLHSHFTNGRIDGGRIGYVNLFSIVAVFILLIACVNFMNLTTAQSLHRAREIGVRKVMGAVRIVLIRQFLGESLLLTTFSVGISLVLIQLLLPMFNQITQKQLFIPWGQANFWLKLGLVILSTGCIAGTYPALFLSSFHPVRILKGTQKASPRSVWFRKGLVVFQFVLSGVLIMATIIVSKQLNFIQSYNLGYDRENLIYIPMDGDLLGAKYDLFKNEALQMPGVVAVSNIDEPLNNFDNNSDAVSWEGKDPNNSIPFANAAIGYDFMQTLRLKMLEGRDFSKGYPSDSANYIINQAAQQKLGYAHPVGRTLTMWATKGTIIGLVKDFHFASLHEKIQPMILRLNNQDQSRGYVLLRIRADKTKQILAGLETLYRKLNPAFPFTFSFSDEQYRKLYESERIVGHLSYVFSFLAVFISCLGLLGLAMFTAEQRVKEIGIRKVLGAGVGSLFALLSSEFLILVFISSLIASPVAWFAMNTWLRGFAYHTPIQWWEFGLSGGLILLIALGTVCVQSLKAALLNPIKSLKSE